MNLINSSKNILLDSSSDGGGGPTAPAATTAPNPAPATTPLSTSKSAPASDKAAIYGALEKIKAASPEVPASAAKAAINTNNVVKPSVNQQPPAELLEMEFSGDLEGDNERPTGEIKKASDVKTEPKKDEPTKPQTPPATTSAKKQPIELADEEDKPFLKKMDFKAAEHFLNKQVRLKQELEASKKLVEESKRPYPTDYLAHPEAYSLLPEYGENVQLMQQAEREYQHWHQQLVNIEDDKPWTDIVGMNEDGSLKVSQPQQPSTDFKIKIQAAMQKLVGLKGGFQAKVKALQNGFKQEREAQEKTINDEVKKLFTWEAKPEELKSEYDFGPNIGKKTVEGMRNEFVNMVPSAFRGSIMTTKVGANMYAAMQLLGLQNAYKDAEIARLKQTNGDIHRAEPTSEVLAGREEPTGKITEFSMDGVNL